MVEPLAVQDAYREEVTLAGDIRLRLRFIQPTDKRMLAEGFRRLSRESVYRRFFEHKTALTERELRFFTETDGTNHVAIGAFEVDEAGNEEAMVGTSRFVRLKEDPEGAEFSVTVADDRQGKGLGRLLLERLLAVAAEHGLKYFQGYLLPENEWMIRLIKHVRQEARFNIDRGVMSVEFPVAPGSKETRFLLIPSGHSKPIYQHGVFVAHRFGECLGFAR